jgi:hypothetical protein
MFFYRRPAWGIGFRILMVFLLIAGGIAITRSAFRVGFVQGAAAEGVEITAPMFYPHTKGFAAHPFAMDGSFLTVLAIFFGGILLIKLIMSTIGLVMYKRWKDEGGPDGEDWGPYHKFGHHPAFCGPHHMGHWGPYPYPPRRKPADGDSPADAKAEKEEEETS